MVLQCILYLHVHTILNTQGPSLPNYLCNQFLSPLKVVSELETCSWQGALCTTFMWKNLSVTCSRSVVFTTNKTERHDITEILLKVALNTITLTHPLKLGSAGYQKKIKMWKINERRMPKVHIDFGHVS